MIHVLFRLLCDARDAAELLFLAAALWIVTWLAGLVGLALPDPVTVARVRVN